MARLINIDGDRQGDLKGHGGEQRAVLVYQQSSYDHWSEFLSRDDLPPGYFGENFTVEGLPDDEVCIGDRNEFGEAEFEVTQPRVTCYRLGMRLEQPDMPALLVSHRRPGFYMRVIREGRIEARSDIVGTRRGRHALTVADIDALLYLPNRDPERLKGAVDMPALSPGWRQSFEELLTPAGSAPPVGVEPVWDGFAPMTVESIRDETPTIRSFIVSKSDGVLGEPLKPGQFLTVRVITSAGTPPVRSYFISANPEPGRYRISVKRQGEISAYLHVTPRPGAVLYAAAPRGSFVLQNLPGPVALISAGIGSTPVLAMLGQLAEDGDGRHIWWIHAAQSPTEHAFDLEVRDTLAQLALSACRIFYSRTATGPGGDVISGRLDAARLAELHLPPDTAAYICGPQGFIDSTIDGLAALGLSPERLYSEAFAASTVINPGVAEGDTVVPHAPEGKPGTGPRVTFARTGLSVNWREEDTTLLELAEACDVPTRWSCRSGVCHICITDILEGRPTYVTPPLENPGSTKVLVCCARPDQDLVLDMRCLAIRLLTVPDSRTEMSPTPLGGRVTS